jgi:tetratricopeptide (TPR) repeat protein
MAGFLDKLMALLGLRPETPPPFAGKGRPDDADRATPQPGPPSPAQAESPSRPEVAEEVPLELPDEVHEKITQLSAEGDDLLEHRQYLEAAAKYSEAFALVPEPKTDWGASTWLLTAIGDAFFQAGRYEDARTALTDAMHCPDAIGNPFIHLRLGQAQHELGNEERAADELARAYLQQGVAIFEGDDPKYLAFIKPRLAPPPGGWPAGW